VKFNTKNQFEVGQDIKEKHGYIAKEFDEEMANSAQSSVNYQLPDGTTISVSVDRFRAPEILFRPSLADQEHAGIHENTFNSIMKCDVDIRRELYDNILLVGGSSAFPGMKERMTKEMVKLLPNVSKVKIVAPVGQKFADFIGGSALAAIAPWVLKDEYDENGPSIVVKKIQ